MRDGTAMKIIVSDVGRTKIVVSEKQGRHQTDHSDDRFSPALVCTVYQAGKVACLLGNLEYFYTK
jgi:hypothetical protein